MRDIGSVKDDFHSLQQIQARHHIILILRSLHWLPVRQRVVSQIV